MTLEQLIKEATARGIVAGATVRSIEHDGKPDVEYTIPHGARWSTNSAEGLYVSDGSDQVRLYLNDVWATVITPAPQAGLKYGDACKDFTPAQKDYALARAKELGVNSPHEHDDGGWLFFGGTAVYHDGVTTAGAKGSTWSQESKNFMPFNQFMELMERTVITKPLTINSYEVKMEDGLVKIGCFMLRNEEVLAVEAAMNREVKVKGVPVKWDDATGVATFAYGHTVKYEDIKKVVELIKTKQQ